MAHRSAEGEPVGTAPPWDPWLSGQAALEVGWAAMCNPREIATLQASRLAALLRSARRTRLFAPMLAGRDIGTVRLDELPIMHKATWMRQFENAVTDPTLKLADLRRFTARPANIGRAFHGRYLVWESSGSSGEPGLFVQDAAALAVYDALESLRWPAIEPLRCQSTSWLSAGERMAFVGALGGHFASIVSIERLRALNAVLGHALHSLSFLQPVAALCAELEKLAPTVIATYPTAAVMLAEERLAGRLGLAPREIRTGGETLTPAMRHFIGQAFGCRVIDSYGSSEFLAMASECRCGRLHVNADWVILEPVDARGRAVARGRAGTTTLLTNLANHVQPLIRYDIGDRVTLHDEPCDCGSALPVIDVLGRCDDALHLPRRGGGTLAIPPLALTTVLEDEAQLFDFQLDQSGPCELTLRTPCGGDEGRRRLQRGRRELVAFLHAQGVMNVRIHCRRGEPPRRGRSGKLQRVIAPG